MASNFTASMSSLSLSDEEEELEIPIETVPNPTVDTSASLVGRFLTDKPIRGHMMTTKIAEFWHPGRGVNIKEIEQNLFTFKFFHYRDMQTVLKRGPWYFDNNLLVLDALPDNTPPQTVPLLSVPFWVRIHDVPTAFMTERVGKDLGNFIGEFLEYDVKNSSNHLRQYMRIRVLLNVTKPLKRQKKIKRPGGDTLTVRFKYERLGNFCYYCGILGHIEDYCDKLYAVESDDGIRHWGSEIRVENQKNSNKESRWLREEGQDWSPPSSSSDGIVEVASDQTLVSHGNALFPSAHPKTVSLAELLKNPHLIRQSSKTIVTNSHITPHNATLNEEEVETVIQNNTKRSRTELTNVDSLKGNLAQSTNSQSSVKNIVQPTLMEVVQNKSSPVTGHFLSAAPGSQGCRES